MDKLMQHEEARHLKCFGISEAELNECYGPKSLNLRLSGDRMLAASIMSDVQELLLRGDLETARQYLNRAKWVLFEAIRQQGGVK